MNLRSNAFRDWVRNGGVREGYFGWQGFTTINRLSSIPLRSKDLEDQDDDEIVAEDRKSAGMLVGIAQDIAMGIGAYHHFAGSDSTLATIAAYALGAKVLTNVASLGIQIVRKYQRDKADFLRMP